MWIKSIFLRDIQSYKHAHISLSKGINLIVGENNSGKSTIIKSLYKLQNKIIGSANIRKGFRKGQIGIVVADSNDYHFGKPNPEDNSVLMLPDADEHLVVFNMVNQGDNAFYLEAKHDRLFSDKKGEYLRGADEFGKFQEARQFHEFSSDEPDNFIYPFLSRRKSSHFNEGTTEKASHHVSESLSALPSKLSLIVNPTHPECQNFLDACKQILGFSIGSIPGDHGGKAGAIVRSGEYIPLETMGDGVSNIVGLLMILFTEKGKLFLIEELENDIHPKALKQLLKLIAKKSSDNQFVISTHSNIVLQHLGAIEGSKIFRTELSFVDNTPTSTVAEIPNTPEAKRLVLEELGYELYDYNLWSGYLILEESSAEVIIKEYLIPWFVPKLNGKLRTVSANGKDKVDAAFEDFQRMFLFTHLEPLYKNKAWVAVDSDGTKIVEELKHSYKGWNQKNFITFSKKDFEEYYPKVFKAKVNSVLSITDKQDKRKKKKDLINEVKLWISKNPALAQKEFKTSAAEIIVFLKEIEKVLV